MAKHSLLNGETSVVSYAGRGARGASVILAVAAFVLVALALEGTRTANSQVNAGCEATDLGTLGRVETTDWKRPGAGRLETATLSSSPIATRIPIVSPLPKMDRSG